jgi:hypothetical protein
MKRQLTSLMVASLLLLSVSALQGGIKTKLSQLNAEGKNLAEIDNMLTPTCTDGC